MNFTKDTIVPFLQTLINKIEMNELPSDQEMLLTQYYLKQDVIEKNGKLERDIWDYLSLGIYLLESDNK